MEYANLTVDYTLSLTVDKVIVDPVSDIIFLSAIGYKSNIDKLIMKMNERKHMELVLKSSENSRVYLYKAKRKYKCITKRIQNSDFVHAIIYQETYIDNDANKIRAFIYRDMNDETFNLYDKIYEIIDKYSPVPFLKEWTEYIVNDMNLVRLENSFKNFQSIEDMNVYSLSIYNRDLQKKISEKLEEKEISINGTNKESPFLKNCTGLDDYLNIFGESLAKKIQENFVPKFIPDVDKYDYHINICDDYIHNNGIELYEAQKAVSQSIVNNWKENSNTLLIGECGCGKTMISSLATFAHHANMKKGFNAIVMCPTHIVEKWKRELEMTIPNSRGYIVHNIKELLDLKPKLTNKYRTENMFVIISKETAKFGYDLKPAAVWSKRRKYFICPDCGKKLYREEKDKNNRNEKIEVPLTELDFASPYTYNQKCPHCNTKLWAPLNKRELDNKWIKLSKSGWILKEHVIPLRDEMIDKENLDKKGRTLMQELIAQCNNVNENGDFIVRYKGSRKYPIAKFIKERMKNVFDYGLIDEA